MVPAMGLAAAGLVRLVGGRFGRDTQADGGLGGGRAALGDRRRRLVCVGHATDGAELARLVERESVRLLPGSVVEVGPGEAAAAAPDRPRWSRCASTRGSTGLGGPTIRGRLAPDRSSTSGRCSTSELRPRQVVVAQPTLRLGRRPDGSWNLQGMLADPWPLPTPDSLPRILVRNGTVLLADGPTRPLGRAPRRVDDPGADVRPALTAIEGTARGDGFDRLSIEGVFDTADQPRDARPAASWSAWSWARRSATGSPREWRPSYRQVGIEAGELDVTVSRLVFDPSAPAGPLLDHDLDLLLRSGTFACPKLPFPLNEVEVRATVRDGLLEVEYAKGTNGRTNVRAIGTVDLNDLTAGSIGRDLRGRPTWNSTTAPARQGPPRTGRPLGPAPPPRPVRRLRPRRPTAGGTDRRRPDDRSAGRGDHLRRLPLPAGAPRRPDRLGGEPADDRPAGAAGRSSATARPAAGA